MNQNRRQLLKTSAIGGGISKLWATPVISSIIIPAHAQSSVITQPETDTCQANQMDSDAFVDKDLPISSQLLSVKQYSGNIEDLSSVKVTLRGRVYGDGQFENRQASETEYTLTVDSDFSYLLPFDSSSSHTFKLTDNKKMTLPAFDGEVDFKGTSSQNFTVDTTEQMQQFELTSAQDIAVFVGSGQVDFIAEVMGTFNALGSSQQANATFLYAEGSVEVEYVCA